MRVWDADSGECLETIDGNGNVQAMAAGSVPYPYRLISRGLESVVKTTTSGEPVAWFPVALSEITTHPAGHKCAAAGANHVYILDLVGDATVAEESGG